MWLKWVSSIDYPQLDNLVEGTLDQKEKYVEAVRKEVADRDLSEEKIKKCSGAENSTPLQI